MGNRVGTRKASRDATDSGREGSRFNTFGFRVSHWPRAVLCAIAEQRDCYTGILTHTRMTGGEDRPGL